MLNYLSECIFAFARYPELLPFGRGIKRPFKALVPLWRTIAVNNLPTSINMTSCDITIHYLFTLISRVCHERNSRWEGKIIKWNRMNQSHGIGNRCGIWHTYTQMHIINHKYIYFIQVTKYIFVSIQRAKTINKRQMEVLKMYTYKCMY